MNEQDTMRIEAYFNRTLNDAERAIFEEDLQTNPELKELFDELQFAMDVIDQQAENELRSKFSTWRREKSGGIKKHFALITSLAAGIALVIGVFYFIQKSKPGSYTELAMNYYNLPESPEHAMGNEQAQWQEGIAFFNKKMYKEAAGDWETMTNTDTEVKYYLAHCYFNLNEYAKATALFNELAVGTSVYSYSAEWNLVLSMLMQCDREQAANILEKIISVKNHPYYAEAIALKRKLNKIKFK